MFSQLPWLLHQLRGLNWRAQIHVFLTCLGLIWVGVGLYILLQSSGGPVEVTSTSVDSASLELGLITVDVSGAVASPGVYQLRLGARVGEALAAAGGVTTGVDQEQIAKNLNLAEKVTDGQKIYVPRLVEEIDESLPESDQTLAEQPTTANKNKNQRISINTASDAELESLPGIGTKKASDIIAGRPYSSLAAAQAVAKVSDDVWLEIIELITL